MKLYEITQTWQLIDEMLEKEEITEEEGKEMIELLKNELETKADNIIKYTKNIDYEIETLDSEIKRLQNLKKIRKNKKERLKEHIKNNLQTLGIKKVETSIGRISTRKSERVEVIDIEKIPNEYKEIKYIENVNKNEIKKAIKEGKQIDGVKIIENQNIIIK